MNRRNCLMSLTAGVAGSAARLQAAEVPGVLLVDLEVDPAKESQLVATYRNEFRPAIRKQPGFHDVKLLKLVKEAAGKAPAGCTYRLLISFQTEAQRLKWVETPEHQKVWPAMEKCLRGQKYIALVYDTVA